MTKFGLAGALAVLTALTPAITIADNHADVNISSQHKFNLTKIAQGLENPWGLDWLPDGRIIVTERPGRLRIVSKDGKVSEALKGLPKISSDFRDGLLDIAVSPNFTKDQKLFFAYSNKQEEGRWQEVATATLDGNELQNVKTIFSSGVKVKKNQGFGSRIRFAKDGTLFVTVGDHAVKANAQDPSNTLGSIIRINTDGTPAKTNPGGKLNPAIYAYGFKNPQGMTIDANGIVWAVDHGGVGGGELNRVLTGKNYGWPTRAFGGGDKPGAANTGDFEDPYFTWGASPTVSLSGLELYTGGEFAKWTGDLFAGSLSTEAVIRIMLDGAGKVVGTEQLIEGEIGRIREVRQGPDGRLYLLNDDKDGGIYRIDPVH